MKESGNRSRVRTEVASTNIGPDHNLVDGPLHLFKTTVFGRPMDEGMERHSTGADAVAGHEAIVTDVSRSLQ
jgi:hypothetical protein